MYELKRARRYKTILKLFAKFKDFSRCNLELKEDKCRDALLFKDLRKLEAQELYRIHMIKLVLNQWI